MVPKLAEKQKAIALRKQGKTYSEILKVVPVAKSTISLWLQDVGLSKPQKQVITQKRKEAQMKGASARRRMRQEKTFSIYTQYAKEIGKLSKRERTLIGAALYWAEGAKEKAWRPGQRVDFGNTDPEMIKFFVRWLTEIVKVDINDIYFSLYIHKNHEQRVPEVLRYWKTAIDMPRLELAYVCFKKHNPKTVRKNTNDTYHGTLRMCVRRSADLQRRLYGWVYGITGAPCRVV